MNIKLSIRQGLSFFERKKIQAFALFLFLLIFGGLFLSQNIKAQTATNGACVVRTSSASLPSYSSPDSGSDYRKYNKPGLTTITDLQDQCLPAGYNPMITSLCAGNVGPMTLDVVLYDETGVYLSNSCPSMGCSSPCPVLADSQAPTAPSSLTGTVSGMNITFSWTASTDNVGVTAYKIFRNGSFLSSLGTALTYTDTVSSAGSYSYYVKATDAAGNESDQSNTINLSAGSTPPTISVLVDGQTGTVTKAPPATYTVSWVSTGAESCRQTGTWGWSWGVKPTSSSWSFTGVTVTGVKTYTVECRNSGGQTATDTVYVDISSGSVSTSTPLTAPSGLTATVSGSTVTLAWTDNSNNEAGFKIYRNSGSGWTDMGNVGTNVATFINSSVPGGNHSYKVNAFTSSYIYSGVSNEVSVTVTGGISSGQIDGACILRDAYTSMPNYGALDSSSGYAKLAKPGYSSLTTLQTACSSGDYELLLNEYCKTNSNPVQQQIATFDSLGNIQSTSCGAYGCNYKSCPVQTATLTATSTLPRVEVKVDGVRGSISRSAPATYTVSWSSTGAESCRQTGIWGWDWGVKPSSSSWYFTGVSVTGVKTYTVECRNIAGQIVSDIVSVNIISSIQTATTTPVVPIMINASVGGQVLDPDGKPLANAGVHVYKPDFTFNAGSVTDSSGNFQIPVVAGSYIIEAFPPSGVSGFIKPSSISFYVNAGETKSINVQFKGLEQSVKILQGTAKFSNQNPVTDAEVEAFNTINGQWFRVKTGQLGEYSLNLTPGNYKIGIRPLDPKTSVWQWSDSYDIVDLSSTGPETKIMNFIIQMPENKITVMAIDENNNPIFNVGIIISREASENSQSYQVFRKTQNSGQVIFFVKPGQYKVAAFLPPNIGYLNPEKQEFYVSNNEEKNLVFIFKKPEILNSAIITGFVKTEDGATVSEAAIWGWSDKGGFLESKTDTNGQFNLTVPLNSGWHLGAGKKIGSYAFKSSDVSVKVSVQQVSVDLVLFKLSNQVLPEPVTVTKPSTQPIIVQALSGAGVVIPAGASGGSGNLNLQLAPTAEAPSQFEARVVGTVYDVSLKDEAGKEIKTLADEIEITIPYDEKALKKSGTLEGKITPNYYDEETGTWVKVEKYIINKESNQVKIYVKHLTRFALVAPADTVAPMPPTNSYIWLSGKQSISLAWFDPKIDFHHTKVYRSEKKNQLGEVVSALVTNSKFEDTSVQLRKTYYYTLIAVDAAGNESEGLKVAAKRVSGKTEKAPKINTNPAKFTKYISSGRKGTDVKILQQFLQYQGFFPETAEINGVFDALTVAAVKDYQKAKGIKSTGILDTRTRAVLNKDESSMVLGEFIAQSIERKWINSGKMVFYKTPLALIPVTNYNVFIQNGGNSKLLEPAIPEDFVLPLWTELVPNDLRLN